MPTNDVPVTTTRFRNITVTDFGTLTPRPRLVDVREPAEFTGELGHIPGAELVPLATLEPSARAWPKDEEIVVVCRSGGRSAKAAAQLADLGFQKVQNLTGGTQAYVDAGLPVER